MINPNTMQKQLLLLVIGLLSLTTYSQIKFEKGHFIDNTGQQIECLIKNSDWRTYPNTIEYKITKESEVLTATIDDVSKFEITGISNFIRANVDIDRSLNKLKQLSTSKAPEFKKEQVFLKILVEGEANLFMYQDGNLKRYYYNLNQGPILPLVYKKYIDINNRIQENERFKQQLYNDLQCHKFQPEQFEVLDYKRSSLESLFISYNKCLDSDYLPRKQIKKREFIKMNIRPRINQSSLDVKNSASSFKEIDFGNGTNFGLGLEIEYILPFNKNKWALTIEPTYQYFEADKTYLNNRTEGGEIVSNVQYSSLEIPLAVRHYFFLNPESKIFVNAGYVVDLSLRSTLTLKRNNGTSLNDLDFDSRNNIAFGIGYKFKGTYSIEFRHQTSREILGNYAFWSSNYNTNSLILGFTIF